MIPELSLVLPVLGLAILYGHGLRRLPAAAHPAPAARIRAALGAVLLFVALGPFVEGQAEAALSMHMVQHQLLTLGVAPLVATSGLWRTLLAAARRPVRRPRGSGLAAALAALLHLVTMLVWHVPVLYDLALRQPEVHHLEHLTMLGTAILAWATIFSAARNATQAPGALVGLAALTIGGAALGVVLLTAPEPLYAWYDSPAAHRDQGLAGAVMKVGALVGFGGAAAAVAASWLRGLVADDTNDQTYQPAAPRWR